ncbi:AraC family transcriptional regulator [Nocardia farcinica]|uniref:AraC family transcriptional regulator n=1 Tax=Nocardia farcinica TaxID=37329 RepID=UPI000E03B56B|nr:AraC family transcriptional regulator [Nocardia farcinica]SUE29150.1 AraC family transcriptional regulator [Nocardia farcinica]
MDVLEALLDGPRARGAFLLRSLLDPPWALRIEDGAPLTVAAPLRGEAWLLPDDGDAVRLSTGDVAIVRGPGFYTVADDPATEPSVVVLPGGLCTSAEDGRSLVDEWSLGVRTWGAPEGRTTLLTGTYDNAGEASKPLLAALPALVVLRRDQWRSPLIDVLAEEMQIAAPGQRAVLDRLLDVLLISALRTWFAAQREHAPAWYRAQQDPVVGVALARIHGAPERPWTVATLAAEAGVSRANLAKRFTDLLGEPPMAYLTHWRLAVAADLLTDPEATVTSVARRVGYSTPFAFSTAFKRACGISPQQHRLRGATA